MPYILDTTYRPAWPFRNADFNTIFSAYFRRVPPLTSKSEVLQTPDGDILKINVAQSNSKTLTILLHGLEGDMQSLYIRSTMRLLYQNGIDVLAFNFRNCGFANRKLQSYHGGWTQDLAFLIEKMAPSYDIIFIAGFSLGGNIALKYAGNIQSLHPKVAGVLALSTPVDLKGAVLQLDQRRNRLYQQNFLWSLKKKIKEKQLQYPDSLSGVSLKKVRTLYQYDDTLTASIYGFSSANDYYRQCNALQDIPNLSIPAVLINSLDDSFLSADSHPKELAGDLSNFTFHQTQFGGHLGFYDKLGQPSYGESLLLDYIKSW